VSDLCVNLCRKLLVQVTALVLKAVLDAQLLPPDVRSTLASLESAANLLERKPTLKHLDHQLVFRFGPFPRGRWLDASVEKANRLMCRQIIFANAPHPHSLGFGINSDEQPVKGVPDLLFGIHAATFLL
jgi:hypothetical protein